MSRTNLKIDTFISILNEIKNLSVSQTLKVACLALKKDFSSIAAFGYNGRYPNCSINPNTNGEEISLLPGESGFIHAEVNMICKFKEKDPENYIVLLTTSPCLQCSQILINAGFKYIYWENDYRDTSHLEEIFHQIKYYGNFIKLKEDILTF